MGPPDTPPSKDPGGSWGPLIPLLPHASCHPTKPTGLEAEIKVGADDTLITLATGGQRPQAPSERVTRACSREAMGIPDSPLPPPATQEPQLLGRRVLGGPTAVPPISASCFSLGKGRIAPPPRQKGVTCSQQQVGVRAGDLNFTFDCSSTCYNSIYYSIHATHYTVCI